MNTTHYLTFLLFLALPASPITPQTSAKQLPPSLYLIFENGKCGYMDSTGKVRIQPVFASAESFSEGLAAVRKSGQYGYIDIQGKWVIPPAFDYAEYFENGKALVWVGGKSFAIDRTGKRCSLPPEKEEWTQIKFRDGLEKEAESLGYLEITPEYNGRRFAEQNHKEWYLTDSKGKKISETPFKEVLGVDSGPLQWEEIWAEGLAFVETKDGIGAIDLDGNFKVPVREFGFKVAYFERKGDYIVLSEDISEEDNYYNYRQGLWNWKTNFLLKPRFYELNVFNNNVIEVLEKDLWGYITPQGKYLWQEKPSATNSLPALNIDFMLRGNFYAASPNSRRFNGAGGWAPSDNYAHKIIKPHAAFEPDKIQLKAVTQEDKVVYGKSRGFALYLVNTTTDTVVLPAEDSRLNMVIQAKDSVGTWRDITFLPVSHCGNSNHRVFLAPEEYWNFTVPVMEGAIRTKMRVLLKAPLGSKADIISNEYEGGVNPAQFWRKDGYAPASIMDHLMD